MTVKEINCQNNAPAYNYTPFYFSCYGNKPLPNCIKANIGPVQYPAGCPSATCYGFPDVATDINLCRVTDCDWQSGTIVFSNSNYRTGLTLFVTPYQNIFQEDPDTDPIGSVWRFSGDPTPEGSCDWNPITGETTGIMRGVASFEPEGGCANPCRLPYIIYFGLTS